VEAVELAHDLWRWTGRRDTIGADVGSVYYKSGTDIVLIDPLLPPEDPDGFWRALDRDVLPGDSVHVLLTTRSHTRSAHELAGRYPGGRLWNRREHGEPPAGVAAYASGRSDEVVFWIAEHGALVIGDVIVGDGAGGLRLGSGTTQTAVAAALHEVAQLPVKHVLPSHGDPVEGADALRALVG
jgi:glyoxylase-like metal-dependent hydrolase (beta-lactamase superfamily II)